MKVQVTVVVSDGKHAARVESATMELDPGHPIDPPDAIVANAARNLARRAGLGLDEVSKARSFTSSDEKEAALLAFLKETLEPGPPPLHLHEEAREIGWTDEEILEAVGHLALNEFQSLIASAAALPQDQGGPRALPSAA